MSNRDEELGGLWLRDSKAGNKYMSGRLTIDGETVDVVVFKNTHKQPGERTPDYRVYRSQPREDAPQQRHSTAPQPRRQPTRAELDDELSDEIPF